MDGTLRQGFFLKKHKINISIVVQDRKHISYHPLCVLSVTHFTLELYEKLCQYIIFDPTISPADEDQVFYGSRLKKAIERVEEMVRKFVACNNSMYNPRESGVQKQCDGR